MAILWREVQRQNFTNIQSFLEFVEITLPTPQKPSFPLNVPKRLASKIKKKDPLDPIFVQFFPSLQEEEKSPLFITDPVSDLSFQKKPKLLHKYQGRALLLCTSACAMHCRYCFRQNFPYETEVKTFEEELLWIQEDPTLEEIILSGGDPLSLSDETLKKLLVSLGEIPHVKRIRFHTRFPIGIPERIDTYFLNLLGACPKQIIFVIHSNHAQEWDAEILTALKEIQKIGIPVLCQTVLLKGVNDSEEALRNLFSLLTNHGILPYYLHQLDKVEGALHFEVKEKKGLELLEKVSRSLSGYAIPKYVQEIPGAFYKTPITSCPES